MRSQQKAEFRLALFLIQQGRCAYCGGDMSFTRRKNGMPARDFATFEHVERREDGGKLDHQNIVLAHTKCNRQKNIEDQRVRSHA